MVSAKNSPGVARAVLIGAAVALTLCAGISAGNRGLEDFDTALVPCAAASVFTAFGLGYRYAMWLQRPPTRLYWRRGWGLFFAPQPRGDKRCARAAESRSRALSRSAISRT